MRAVPILVVGLLVIAAAAAAAIRSDPRSTLAVTGVAAAGTVAAILLLAWSARQHAVATVEPRDVEDLDEGRRRELIRGTSMHLREMRYRYSVRVARLPAVEPADRQAFTAVINEIRLGFVPAVITDNRTDDQGLGYVAFVYDGRRWRGPGLPCPQGRDAALRHAARCVSPLDEPEEGSPEGPEAA